MGRAFWEDQEQPEPAAPPPPAPDARAAPDQVKPPAAAQPPQYRAVSRPASNQYGLILGEKGAGKTMFARHVYIARVNRGGRGVFVDPRKGETSATGVIVRGATELQDEFRRAVQERRGFSVVVQLGWGESYDPLWRPIYNMRRTLVVLDEMHLVAEAGRIDGDLKNLIAMGRNQEIDVICTTQTPPQAHKLIRGLADWFVAFRQQDPEYAEQINNEFFRKPGLEKLIMELPDFHYLYTRRTGDVSRGVVKP